MRLILSLSISKEQGVTKGQSNVTAERGFTYVGFYNMHLE